MAITYVLAKLKKFNAINIKTVKLEPDYSVLKISYMIWGKSLNFLHLSLIICKNGRITIVHTSRI